MGFEKNYCSGDFPPLLSSDCCYSKTVGGVLYSQIAGDTEDFPECTPGCVYEPADSPGEPFCFKPGGDDVSECKGKKRNTKYLFSQHEP